MTYTGTLAQFMAQCREADEAMQREIEKALARGFKCEAPGVYVLRDENGEIVETMEF